MKIITFIFSVAAAFLFGFKAQQIYILVAHPNYCPIPASRLEVMGCEAVMETAQSDKWDAQADLWRCQNIVTNLESTIDCMMRPDGCRSKDPNEEPYNEPAR